MTPEYKKKPRLKQVQQLANFPLADARKLLKVKESLLVRDLKKTTTTPEERQDLRGRLSVVRQELQDMEQLIIIKEGGEQL
jgi:hypothetical protein